jgi:hypothetical protein
VVREVGAVQRVIDTRASHQNMLSTPTDGVFATRGWRSR